MPAPARRRICVVGDLLADTDITGRAERLSPEAPVPVVDQQQVVHRPGGAGLAATLAARHGAQVTLVAAAADDEAGRRLARLLEREGVRLVRLGLEGSTVEKIRIRTATMPIVRLDRGGGQVSCGDPTELLAALGHADAVLVADYGAGVAELPTVRRALAGARAEGVPLVWDPHPRGPVPIRNATVVCPNQTEAERFAGGAAAHDDLAGAVQRARTLRTRWDAVAVAVTRGDAGAVVCLGDGAPLSVPVPRSVQGADSCGAGDAFAAAAVVALADGKIVSEAVAEAVAAAASFVAAGGATGVVSPSPELDATEPRAGLGGPGATLVATGGCFDLLHPGHVHTLRAARLLGDRLVVLLNDDASVRRLKGPDRPLQTVSDRRAVLESLRDVDEVLVFSEDTPVEALRRLRPDVFVKGGDYIAGDLPETAVLAEWGGTVVTVPFLDGSSTTTLLTRARAARHRRSADARMG